MSSGINIIIPMAGIGSRFSKAGYNVPKPLINILASPMIVWLIRHLNIKHEDKVFLALRRELEDKYDVCDMLRREFPGYDITPILLRERTRGAAETLALVLSTMNSEELSRPVLSLDCDTIYFEDIVEYFRRMCPASGLCACFEDYGRKAMYSYIRTDLDKNLEIVAIAEKKRISNLANTGAYGFPSARLLAFYIHRLLQNPIPQSGEYYVSSVISDMLGDGIKFLPRLMSTFQCVGTPEQLGQFLQAAKSSLSLLSLIAMPRKTLVFDVECIPDLCNQRTLTLAQLQEYIPKEGWVVMRGMENMGYEIRLSMRNGSLPRVEGENAIKFIDRCGRWLAQKEWRFFHLDRNLSTMIGY